MYKTLIALALVTLVILQGSSTQRERRFHLADMHMAQVRSVPMPLLVRASHLTKPTVPTRWPEPTTVEPRITSVTTAQAHTYTTDWGKWEPILQCESNGNWQANTGNGFYGGLQFALSSWKWVGGSGYPHEATPQEQILRAEKLLALQGWKAWPACSLKVGYR